MTKQALSIALLLSLSSCATINPNLPVDDGPLTKLWYKGNTHVHTTLSGHADTTPDKVAAWYLDHGYNFLTLSEHNKFIDPATITLPENRRKDFVLVPGEEITGGHGIHTTALNIQSLVPWKFDYDNSTTSQAIQHHVDGAHHAGGVPILNHPNFHYAVTSEDILDVHDLYMFELYNGHPTVNSFGDESHVSTEKMWDKLLTQGMKIYGVSSDDAHEFKSISPKDSNPGRGWVMVQAAELTPNAISAAMLNGDFYSSNGVTLKNIERSLKQYSVEVDEKLSAETLSSPILRGKFVAEAKTGYRIDFIGPGGNVLTTKFGTKAQYNPREGIAYVRVRVSYTRALASGGFEQYYAWGQPAIAQKSGVAQR